MRFPGDAYEKLFPDSKESEYVETVVDDVDDSGAKDAVVEEPPTDDLVD